MSNAPKSIHKKKEFAAIHFAKIPLVRVIAKAKIEPGLESKARLR
jgi:hypothetical protein